MFRRKVPVVLQMESVECGAACLTMVLGYHGHHVRLSEVREACGVSRDGMSAEGIEEAAASYGLEMTMLRLEPEDLARFDHPVILHWEMNHFLLLDRWSPKKVRLIDPGMGHRAVTPEEFDRSFTGIVLDLEPTESFRKRRRERTAVRRYMKLLSGTFGALAIALSASLLVNLLGLAIPIGTQVLLDRVVQGGETSWLDVVGGSILALVLFHFALQVVRGRVLVSVRERLDVSMTTHFVRHMLRLPTPFFLQRHPGDLVARIQSNKTIRDLLAGQALSGLVDGVLLVTYLVLMLLYDLALGLVVALGGAVYLALYAAAKPFQVSRFQARQLVEVKEKVHLLQIVKGILTLKSAGAEESSRNDWLNKLMNALNAGIREVRLENGVSAALFVVKMTVPAAVLWWGAHRVLAGEMTLGVLIAFQMLQLGFLVPLEKVVQTLLRLQILPVHLNRMDDVLQTEPETSGTKPAPRLRGAIRFEDVSFRYGRRSPLVLEGIDLSIEAGRKVALVGPSGSGKSTLARLIMGLYSPSGGRILLDENDLAELDLDSVRRQIGVVHQETSLFQGTLRENLSLYYPNAPLEDVVSAARVAQIHEDIESLPLGYETQITGGSGVLSGGQRQRLALARAILHRPPILVLDEATSALDAVTESAIEKYLSTRRCTRIVIAHRLSTIRDADRILVLEDGRIVEDGSHEELLAHDGLYSRLVRAEESSRERTSRAAPGPDRIAAADLERFEGLKGLSGEGAADLASQLERRICPAGATILVQGDRNSELYLIEEGEIEIQILDPGLPPWKIAEVGPGSLLGEISLLDGSANSATALARSETRMLVLPHGKFRDLRQRGDRLAIDLTIVLGRLVCRRLREVTVRQREIESQGPPRTEAAPAAGGLEPEKAAEAPPARALELGGTPFGAMLAPGELELMEEAGDFARLGAGEVLFREGDTADSVHVLLAGRVGVSIAGVEGYLSVLKPGQMFGELAFFEDEPRSATCAAITPSVVYRVRHDVLRRLVDARNSASLKLLHHLSLTAVRYLRIANCRLREAAALAHGEQEHAFRAREEARGLAQAQNVELALFRASDRSRVPIVLESGEGRSSAACLTSLLHFHGRPVPPHTVEETCLSEGGYDYATFAKAVRSYGFSFRRMELPLEDTRAMDVPLVLRTKAKNFLVGERWQGGRLLAMDPTSGRRALSEREAREELDGVSYEIRPDESAGRARSPWERLRRFAAAKRRPVFRLLAATVLLQLSLLAFPMATGLVVNEVLPAGDLDLLQVVGVAIAGLLVFQLALTASRDGCLLYLRTQLDRDLLDQLMGHVLRLPIPFFERNRPGTILQRFNAFRILRDLLGNQTLGAFLDVAVAFASIVLMAAIDFRLALPVLGVAVAYAGAVGFSVPSLRRRAEEEVRSGAEQVSRLVEILTGLATLRVAGNTDGGIDRWRPPFMAEVGANAGQERHLALLVAFLEFLRLAAVALLLWWGVSSVLDGRLSLGMLVAILGLASPFLLALQSMAGQLPSFLRSATHLEPVAKVFAEPREQEGELAASPGKLRGRIALENVSFRYTPDGPEVIRNVSLEIAAGMKVALVGPSGCGKSTLGKLLLGFYLPTSGRILFDGKDLGGLELREVRKQLGVVLQETYLFGASLRDNLSLNAPGSPMSKIVAAAGRAAIHETIEGLPMKYETVLAEGGATFSGGQRQRIAMARALVHDPAILLLDEATSALDNLSQAEVERNLSEIGSTRIVIAHRLSTIQDADLIVAVVKGSVAEAGTHKELLARRGVYWKLVEAQVI